MKSGTSGIDFALALANAATEEDMALLPLQKGDIAPDDLQALAEGLYRVGCLIAYADGHGERSDIEPFTSIRVKDGNTVARAYLPTTRELEDTMAAEGEEWDHESYSLQVPVTMKAGSEEFPSSAGAARWTDGDWITVELMLTRYDCETEGTEREVFAILAQLAADSQIRGVQIQFWYGQPVEHTRIWYQQPWYTLASAPRKRRPGVCRNCGRLHISHNARGNIATTCSPECTTAYNNEKKRLARIHDKNDLPFNSDLDILARRAHERRPLQFPGKPEGIE
jgi:hypothetical protein